MPYCLYLRKSRADAEAESRGEGETLARHEAELMRTAARLNLSVSSIYREIVSGETIAARPVMQQLLTEIEQGGWDGVLVMEVERLARGDTIDQGIVSQAFKFSDTKIITPMKTYDPNNEYDEEYFEFGLFMSRREYKTINRRLQRGRLASVNEGKYVCNKPPCGYLRVKLTGQKGWTLEPDPDTAPIVQRIFEWYTTGAPGENGQRQRLGAQKITRRLNDMGIPSYTGRDWTAATVKDILHNPVYAGWIRWGSRATVKRAENGVVKRSRPRAADENVHLARGLHLPLISQETYDRAQAILTEFPSRPGPSMRPTKNPLAGLIVCGSCGRKMVRRPYAATGYPDGLICPYTSCNMVSSHLDTVEHALLSALQLWLKDFELGAADFSATSAPEDIQLYETALDAAEKELTQLGQQLTRAHELVEQGIYTTDTFLTRSRDIDQRTQDARQKKSDLTAHLDQLKQVVASREQIAPQIRFVLDAYPRAADAGEKNAMLKSVLVKAVYKKTQKLHRRRPAEESDLELIIYPRLPSSIS